jgi:hypothetical protein
VDPDTGDIVDVTAYLEDFNDVPEVHVFSDDEGYLPKNDAKYRWAVQRALRVNAIVRNGVLPIPFDIDEREGE